MLGGVHCSKIRAAASIFIFTISTIALRVYWRIIKICSSICERRTHMEQLFGSSSPSRMCNVTMLGGVHLSNSQAVASPLKFNRFTIAAIALVNWRSTKVCRSRCVRWEHMGQMFGLCVAQKVNDDRTWNNFLSVPHHSGSILLPCLDPEAFHRSNSRATASPLIFTIAAMALVYWRNKRFVALTVYDECSWNKFLSVPLHPGNALVPCLETFIVWIAGQQHPHWYSL